LRHCSFCSLFWQRYQTSGSVNKHYNVTSNLFSRQTHRQNGIHMQKETGAKQEWISNIIYRQENTVFSNRISVPKTNITNLLEMQVFFARFWETANWNQEKNQERNNGISLARRHLPSNETLFSASVMRKRSWWRLQDGVSDRHG